MNKFPINHNVEITADEEIARILAAPGFGKFFTDHIAHAEWNETEKWHGHSLLGREKIALHPAAAALHYGQEIFEGLKAFRHADDSIWVFRPEKHAKRFVASARRLMMEPLPEEDFLASLDALIKADRAWVASGENHHSLYLRPFMFASERMLGVRAAKEYTYLVLATPAQPLYPKPLQLWVTPNYARTAQGGTGMAKCGGNYAGALAAEEEAHAHGCGQVLWLDSATHSLIEEGGVMNFFVITTDGELITPNLNGNILAGVTRDSLLQLAESHGLKAVERPLPLAEVRSRIESGEIMEAFACGTAAVISPVVSLQGEDFQAVIGDGEPGKKTLELRNHLTGIQFGTEPDIFGWLKQII